MVRVQYYIYGKSCDQWFSTEETTYNTTHVQPHIITKINKPHWLRNSRNGLEYLTATMTWEPQEHLTATMALKTCRCTCTCSIIPLLWTSQRLESWIWYVYY